MRPSTCKVCGEGFIKQKMGQKTCSIKCAIIFAGNKTAKAAATLARKEKKAAIEKLKTRQDWLKEAQKAFNEYIRLRDAELPCVSCGRFHQGQYHAGHYRTTKAAPELRFSELNTHKQCSVCNNHLSGNITEYRINLVKKIGVEYVEWLEGPHKPQRLMIEDIKEIIVHYKAKNSELKKEKHGSECG